MTLAVGLVGIAQNSVDNILIALTLRALIRPRIVQPIVRISRSPARRFASTSGAFLRARPYRAGTSPHWIKVKNRKHPAMNRNVALNLLTGAGSFFFTRNNFEPGWPQRVNACGFLLWPMSSTYQATLRH